MWSMAKVIDVSVRQLSKAKRPSCAPGARTLVASSSLPVPTLLREQRSAKTLLLYWTQPGYNLPEDVTALEGSIFKTDD